MMMEADFLCESTKKVQSRFDFEVPEPAVRLALTESRFAVDAVVEFLHNNPGFLAQPVTVVRAVTRTGSRVLAPTPVKQEESDDSQMFDEMSLKSKVKEESIHLDLENQTQNPAKAENGSIDSHEVAQPLEEINVETEKQVSVNEEMEVDVSSSLPSQIQTRESTGIRKSSRVAGYEEFLKSADAKVISKEEYLKSIGEQQQPSVQAEASKAKQDLASVKKVFEKKEVASPDKDEVKIIIEVGFFPCFQKSSWQVKKEKVVVKVEPRPPNVEDGDFR